MYYLKGNMSVKNPEDICYYLRAYKRHSAGSSIKKEITFT
jgi:hypothetical protein